MAVTTRQLMGLGMPAALAELVASIGTGSAALNNNSFLKWTTSTGTERGIIGLNASDQVEIVTGTADAADTEYVTITGGGALATDGSRGARLLLAGNEASGVTGLAYMQSGNQTTGHVQLDAVNASSNIEFLRNAVRAFYIDGNADLISDASTGRNVSLQRAGTAVGQNIQNTVSAAGANIGTATQLTSVFTNVTTVGASTGVKLWIPTVIGAMLVVRNGGANALSLYPPDASGSINGGGGGAAVSIATGAIAFCVYLAANTWIACEAPAA